MHTDLLSGPLFCILWEIAWEKQHSEGRNLFEWFKKQVLINGAPRQD